MSLYADTVFAPLDLDLHLERIAGGNETEVYRTDDARFVVKLKNQAEQSSRAAIRKAKELQAVANQLAETVGTAHSIPNYYFIARNSAGQIQTVAVQPYLDSARQLFEVDYAALNRTERREIARQLRLIIAQALKMYQQAGCMPDLYGRTNGSQAERQRNNAPHMLPKRLWSFMVKRNLLRSHNLMLKHDQGPKVMLVDYDPVERSKLYLLVYYTARRLLFLRDMVLIWLMEKWGYVPGAYRAEAT